MERLNDRREELQTVDPHGIELTEPQAELLSRLAQRVDLPYDPTERTFSFAPIDAQAPKRLTDYKDAEVDRILEEAPEEDKTGYILRNLHGLSDNQRIKLLLELPAAEYEALKEQLQAGFAGLAEDIEQNPRLVPDPNQRIVTRSRLRYATPRYIVETDIRRMYMESGRSYPVYLDDDLEEDTYPEEDEEDKGTRV